jgi:hypothetical protein
VSDGARSRPLQVSSRDRRRGRRLPHRQRGQGWGARARACARASREGRGLARSKRTGGGIVEGMRMCLARARAFRARRRRQVCFPAGRGGQGRRRVVARVEAGADDPVCEARADAFLFGGKGGVFAEEERRSAGAGPRGRECGGCFGQDVDVRGEGVGGKGASCVAREGKNVSEIRPNRFCHNRSQRRDSAQRIRTPPP